MSYLAEYHEALRLLGRMKGISGPEPVVPWRHHGKPMVLENFSESLASAIGKGEDAARSALLRWATTGGRLRSVIGGGFVLGELIRWARDQPAPATTDNTAASASGPPWSEETAAWLVQDILSEWSDTAGLQWLNQESAAQFERWERWG